MAELFFAVGGESSGKALGRAEFSFFPYIFVNFSDISCEQKLYVRWHDDAYVPGEPTASDMMVRYGSTRGLLLGHRLSGVCLALRYSDTPEGHGQCYLQAYGRM